MTYPSGKPDYFATEFSSDIFRCAAWNDNVLPENKLYFGGGYGWNPRIGLKENNETMPRIKSTNIRMQSRKIVIGDTTDWYADDKPYQCGQLFYRDYGGPSAEVGNRHTKGINALFADMHVEHKRQALLLSGENGLTPAVLWYLPHTQ